MKTYPMVNLLIRYGNRMADAVALAMPIGALLLVAYGRAWPTAIVGVLLGAVVFVVGGRIAGLVTANRAAQAGFKPLVLEKGAEDKYLCNSRYTGGVFHIAYRDVMRSEDELYERIEEETEGRASPALAKLVARDAKRGVRWLQSEGMRFIKGGPMEWQNWVLGRNECR